MLKSIINTLNNIVYTVQKYIHVHKHAHIQTKVEQAIQHLHHSAPYINFQQIKSALNFMHDQTLMKSFKNLYMYMDIQAIADQVLLLLSNFFH